MLVCLLITGPAWAANVLQNPGFEPPVTEQGMAQSWWANPYGPCKTVFSLDENKPHSGKTSQKIDCVERTGGASQFLQPLKIEAGKLYKIKLWMRAEGNVPSVGAGLRQHPSPYRMHISATFEPGNDWDLFEFEGVTVDAEENAGLFIWFEAEGSGAVWVDDASVEVFDAKPPGGPPPEGNVIPNGSFEVNPLRTWDNIGAQADWPSTEPLTVAHGRRGLHVRLTNGPDFVLHTPCVEFNGNGETFSLACSARATGAPVTLDVDVLSALQIKQGGSLLHLSVAPTADLTRFVATGPVVSSLNGAYWISVTARSKGNADVWLDAIALSREAASLGFHPAARLEAALTTAVFDNIFAPGEAVAAKLEVFNAEPELTGTLRVRVRDFAENLVSDTPVALKIAANSLSTSNLALPVRRLGAFRADVVLPGVARPLASMVFSVIPRPADVPAARSVVGGHFSTDSDWQMLVARRLGYKWTRIHDCSAITHWNGVEPEKGRWKFYDDQVARVRRAGLEILGEFLRVPVWATTAKEGTDAYTNGAGPYRDPAEFEEYVRAVVAHYKASIHYWEIWNEPYGGFWGGTAEQYSDLAKSAVREARAADPTCMLLAPCTTPYAPEWTEKVLATGGVAGADLFSYHGYGCLSKSQFDLVNKWATREGKLMARWNTETGVTAKTFYRHVPDRLDDSYTRWIGGVPVEEAVSQSLRLFILSLASGADRYFYYWTNVEAGMCPRMTSMSIYEYDKTLRPHGVVYAIAGALLDPCRGAGIREFGSAVTCCFLEREKETVAVVWAKAKAHQREVELRKLPAGTRALDVMGNPLGRAAGGTLTLRISRQPSYLIAPAGRRDALAGSLEAALQATNP
jgi:hypothetical protein